MSGVLLLIFLTVALLVSVEVLEIVRTPPPRPERTIKHVRQIDAWIAGRYPQRFVGEHRDEPTIRSDHWGPFLRGEPTTPEQRDELVIDCAFALEFRARRLFAGAQFKGILQGATSVVWSRSAAGDLKRLLAAHEPGPAARACLDRALGWWRAAIDRGMRIFEWDRPGYDEVTEAFLDLPTLAREAVRVDTAAHQVEVRTNVETIPAEPSPSRIGAVLRIFVLLACAVAATCALWERGGAQAPSGPLDCEEKRRDVLRVAGRMRLEIAADAARAAVLDEIIAAVQAGDDARATALWPKVKDRSTESVLVDGNLFLLQHCDTR